MKFGVIYSDGLIHRNSIRQDIFRRISYEFRVLNGLRIDAQYYCYVGPKALNPSEILLRMNIAVWPPRLFCILTPALGLIKISVLFLYCRIFVVHKVFSDPRNFVITTMIVITVLWIISFTFATIFSCGLHFTDVYYDFDLSERVCVNTLNLGYWFAITDFVTGALVILIPIPLVSGEFLLILDNSLTTPSSRYGDYICRLVNA